MGTREKQGENNNDVTLSSCEGESETVNWNEPEVPTDITLPPCQA